MSEKDYKKLVENKSKLEENIFCVDCKTKNPKWASTRYGTFFCLECAALHRSLGVYLDFVKSVTLDSWDKEAFLPIEYGGNNRFIQYLNTNNLASLDFASKYHNAKTIEYSKRLMEEIKKETGMEPRSNEQKGAQARTKTDSSKSTKQTERTYAVDRNSQQQSNSTLYSANNLSSSLTNLTSLLASKVHSFTEKTKEYGAKLGSTVKNQTKNLIDKGTESYANLVQAKNKPDEQSKEKPVQPRKKQQKDWS